MRNLDSKLPSCLGWLSFQYWGVRNEFTKNTLYCIFSYVVIPVVGQGAQTMDPVIQENEDCWCCGNLLWLLSIHLLKSSSWQRQTWLIWLLNIVLHCQALLSLKDKSTLGYSPTPQLDIISVWCWMHSMWLCDEVLWPAYSTSVSDLMSLTERPLIAPTDRAWTEQRFDIVCEKTCLQAVVCWKLQSEPSQSGYKARTCMCTNHIIIQ